MHSHICNPLHKQHNTELKTTQNKNQNIFLFATSGSEKVLPREKNLDYINHRYVSGNVTKFHEI